jgi:hypothetical protein
VSLAPLGIALTAVGDDVAVAVAQSPAELPTFVLIEFELSLALVQRVDQSLQLVDLCLERRLGGFPGGGLLALGLEFFL